MTKSEAQSTEKRAASGRIEALDFWRGLVLCFIFINHIPGNLFESLTPKNFGFSDSAEAFVFLSGMSLALAYGRRSMRGEWAPVTHDLALRGAKLYGVHILLSCAAIAIFATGASLGHDDSLVNVHGRDLFYDDSWAALWGTVSLGHQLGYFNILPLYITLLAAVSIQLWIARRSVWAMLACSAALYVAARVMHLNIPTWPMKGSWFFDPFDWQLLLGLGVAAGLSARNVALTRSTPVLGLAAFIALGSAFVVTDAFSLWPGLQDWTHGWADLDKTELGSVRLIHFAAIAYLIFGVSSYVPLRRLPIWEPLCLFGRNSLWTFALLSVIAAVGQVLTQLFSHSILMDTGLVGGGLLALYGAARLLEHRALFGFPAASRPAAEDRSSDRMHGTRPLS